MVDDLIYGLAFLLMGLISFLWYRNSNWDRKDPFQVKPTFLVFGVLSIAASIYIFIRLIN